MQCSCGGETVDRQSVLSSEQLRLTYVACTSCGRAGVFRLFRGDVLESVGDSAQDGYLMSGNPPF